MRFLTTWIVIIGCAFTVIRGWQVVGFALAEGEARSETASSTDFSAWQNVPGLRISVLGADLARSASGDSPTDARPRMEQLAVLLAAKPLSPVDWLALAGTRVADAAPQDKVSAAITMSYVTGPNEGDLMVQRGIFGLIEWQQLSQEVHAQTIRDLSGAIQGGEISDQIRDIIKGVLAAKSTQERSEIVAMLAENVPQKLLAGFGI